MRLARICLPPGAIKNSVDNLLRRVELDVLQVDDMGFASSSQRTTEPERSDYRVEGIEPVVPALNAAHRHLYLNPDLRFVGTATQSGLVECLEQVAELFCERGSAETLVCGVRGGNLLPKLDEWLPADLHAEASRVISAQLEMGGGPLAAGLVEGSQVVVAETFDPTAPVVAAAVGRGLCTWGSYESIAALAVAVQFENMQLELGEEGQVEIAPWNQRGDIAASEVELLTARMRAWGTLACADVLADCSQAVLLPTARGSLQIRSVRGQPSTGQWRVRIVIEHGFQVVILLQVPEDKAQPVTDCCQELAPTGGQVRCQHLMLVEGQHPAGLVFLRVCAQAPLRQECEQVLDSLQSSLSRFQPSRIVEPWPTIQPLHTTRYTTISKQEVTLSVDTRPASEWL